MTANRFEAATEYCKVSDRGISHLFVLFDVGSRCACGRKTFTFAAESETPGFRDVPQEQMSPALLGACLRLNTAGTPHVWKATLLLALGDSVIRDARRLRADCVNRRCRRPSAPSPPGAP